MKKCFELIRELREDTDLTQKQIATKIGTTQQQYSKYETGATELSVKALSELANFYHVSTDYLLGRVSYSANLAELEQTLLNDSQLSQLLSNFNKLPPHSKDSVIEYVNLHLLKQQESERKSNNST